MAPRKRRQKTPAVVNKAPDLLPDRAMAEALGWLGRGYRPPPGPPYPWDALDAGDNMLFTAAANRLEAGGVPKKAAEILCWSNGDWRRTCAMIADAGAVQVFPERQHIRLVPKSAWFVAPKAGELPG